MKISVHADMKSTKRGIFQQKTPKITQSWSNQFWIPIANVSVTLQLSFAALVLKDLTNALPKHFNTICSLFLWQAEFSKFQESFSLQKATRSSFHL